ncbi:MAG: flagellar assembly protein FliX [Oceanicaulis sp.]
MKVNGPRNLSGTSGPRKAGKAAPASGFTPAGQSGVQGPAASGGLSGAGAIGSIDALLALQGAGDFREAKKQATERAFSLLDVLDDLKLALLDGALPRPTLVRLMDTLKSRRDATDDPRLEAMLDEVEVRAAVELAKHDA